MTQIYFIRHSETDYNTQHRHDHEGKAELSQSGIERSKIIPQLFAKKGVSAIYSSPLKRCIDTIYPTADKLWIEIQLDPRITEIFLGPIQDRPWNDFSRDFLDKIHNIETPEEYDWYEHMQKVYNRTSEFIDYLTERYPTDTVIVCSHASPILNMLSYIDKQPVDCSYHLIPKNTGLSENDAYIYREV